jgi:hypothetical protein
LTDWQKVSHGLLAKFSTKAQWMATPASSKISPLDKIQLAVKDLQYDPSAPTIDGLRQAKYPFTMLDENVIAPCTTINLPGAPPG